jgi:asparagine synthase (glutamine-hydrolysing)
MTKCVALTPLELATGAVHGSLASHSRPRLVAAPLAELERSLRAALRRTPCLVGFSGGRDSSLLLAVAARLARREGLGQPVPITMRPVDAPAAREDRWQELVIDAVGLDDWVRLEIRDELDLAGPLAVGAHRRHGLLWPANSHFHLPLLPHARGGALVTGVGGDELFLGWPGAALASGAAAPPRSVVRSLAWAAAPAAARRAWVGARTADLAWLSESGRSEYRRAAAAEESGEPICWAPWVRWRASRRWREMCRQCLDALAAEATVTMCHPMLDPAFAAALARAGERRGFATRTVAMRALFAGLLPDELLARSDKASFDEAFWGPRSREFARSWQGNLGDSQLERLVRADRLRAEWDRPRPDARSALLLQAARLAAG